MSEVSGVSETVDAMIAVDEFPTEESINEEIYTQPSAPSRSKHISLGEGLKIILSEGGKRQNVLHILRTLFGAKLVERALQSGLGETLPEQLKKMDALHLVGAIGQAITVDDLEQFFAELKAGDTSREILKYAQIPYLRMWWSKTAKQLPTFWIDHLLKLFRNPMEMIDPQHETPLGREILDAGLRKSRVLALTYYDYATKELIKQGDRTKLEFFFAPREALAKIYAYTNPKATPNGAIVPIFNVESEQVDYYQQSGQVHESGLNAYFLTPFDSKKGLPAKLIFRGTHDTASAHRDFDPSGVGKRVFDRCASRIQDMIASYASRVDSARIEVIGHSLGGSDAQRAIINLIDPSNELKFDDIKLFSFSAPRLDASTINRWNENLNALKEREKQPDFLFNYARHGKDVITWTGAANISGTKDFFIPNNHLVVSSKTGFSATPRHHTASFFKFGNFNSNIDGRTFEFYHDFSEDELRHYIDEIAVLEKTSSWYLTIKSYFVHVETIEELQNRIDELRAEQERLKDLDTETSYSLWLIWDTSRAVLQPIIYYIFGLVAGVDQGREQKLLLQK
ncbi:MAG: hypothetical protein K1060chlam2_00763 [Chlamydiae bacterium]|nr:hypothetical protein [Chlamydiota bacterium]